MSESHEKFTRKLLKQPVCCRWMAAGVASGLVCFVASFNRLYTWMVRVLSNKHAGSSTDVSLQSPGIMAYLQLCHVGVNYSHLSQHESLLSFHAHCVSVWQCTWQHSISTESVACYHHHFRRARHHISAATATGHLRSITAQITILLRVQHLLPPLKALQSCTHKTTVVRASVTLQCRSQR